MRFFKQIKDKLGSLPDLSKQMKIVFIGILALSIIIAAVVFAPRFFNKEEPQETITYDYNEIEQQIADDVKEYLSQYLELPEDVSAQIADVAVQNYDIIMASGVDVVNHNHTDAIKQRIRTAMVALIDDTINLTDDNLDGLSSGIAEIIWNAILNQIEEVTVTEDYEQQYFYLAESIQSQIDELEERKMKVSIQANIKNNASADLDAETLIATVDGMTDEELQKFAESLGLSFEELQALLNVNNNELDEKLSKFEKELTAELQTKYGNVTNGKNGNDGKNGVNGTNGKDGKDGKNGSDGKDGSDGKTTYIAYADDMYGTGFSLAPTETSKYVGTCITTESVQPKDYVSYSNWQIYRTYIITTTTDENNVTTVHIN